MIMYKKKMYFKKGNAKSETRF